MIQADVEGAGATQRTSRAADLPVRRGLIALFVLLTSLCDGAGALRHEGRAASPAFLAPVADVRHRSSCAARVGVCDLQMQLRDDEVLDSRLSSSDAPQDARCGAAEGAALDKQSVDEESGLTGLLGHDGRALGLALRRSAIGVGIGLLLGPMLPMVSTALTGQPAAHAATGAPTSPVDRVTGESKKYASVGDVFRKAGARALGGGRSGAAAGVLQVLSLMWLRTTMNYQYRYGGSSVEVMKKLYEEGGVGRFYRGVGFALVQQPLSRFGDTAANAGMAVLLDSLEATADLPPFIKTVSASAAAAVWRIGLMPVDSFKTSMQVEGKDGVQLLLSKIERRGLGVLYDGSFATLGSSFVGHYPWFATYNTLQAAVPELGDGLAEKLIRNALIGLCASGVSDCCSNSFRVVKTLKQTAEENLSYTDAIQGIIKSDGIQGLLGRGLGTRLVTNGLQGMLFSVVWKLFDEYWK